MKTTLPLQLVLSLSILLTLLCCLPRTLDAASWDPAAADYSGHKGKTLYVSKLGDNSDGSSWQKAFHTIQAALLGRARRQGRTPDHRSARYLRRGESRPSPSRCRRGLQCPDRRFRRQPRLGRQGLGPPRFRRSRERFQELGLVGTVPRHRQELAHRQQDRPDILRDRLRPLDLP